jgi:hypothetical protein
MLQYPLKLIKLSNEGNTIEILIHENKHNESHQCYWVYFTN